MIISDQLGHNIVLTTPFKRIVSLVPSMTELALDFLGESFVVGRTKFCIHPRNKAENVQKIGGTKNPRIHDILALKPDLILANKEENNQEDVTELMRHCQVYVSNVITLNDNYSMIADLGKLLNVEAKASEIIEQSKTRISAISKIKGSVVYLIWQDPIMVAGGDTFIQSMLSTIGLTNVFENEFRYPEKSIKEILDSNPGYIFLSSEPYPFKQKHIEEWIRILPSAAVNLVDGEFFSWYGSRLSKKTAYML